MQALLKIIAAALASGATVAIHALLTAAAGPAPAGVNVLLWGVGSMLAIAGLNYLLGKLPGGVPVAIRSAK